jgi:hypothetical protein
MSEISVLKSLDNQLEELLTAEHEKQLALSKAAENSRAAGKFQAAADLCHQLSFSWAFADGLHAAKRLILLQTLKLTKNYRI